MFINYATNEVILKIVYYGTGLCGKTTNLAYIHERTTEGQRSKLLSLATQTDRTLFFDLLPVEVGTIAGMKIRLQLYTVPGQVFYNATRKTVLKGADGVVFVVDSQAPLLRANVDAMENLVENLESLDQPFAEMPLVIQYNKRDLPGVLPLEVLESELNPRRVPSIEAVAAAGTGVPETLKTITKILLKRMPFAPDDEHAASRPAAPPERAPEDQVEEGIESNDPLGIDDAEEASAPASDVEPTPVPGDELGELVMDIEESGAIPIPSRGEEADALEEQAVEIEDGMGAEILEEDLDVSVDLQTDDLDMDMLPTEELRRDDDDEDPPEPSPVEPTRVDASDEASDDEASDDEASADAASDDAASVDAASDDDAPALVDETSAEELEPAPAELPSFDLDEAPEEIAGSLAPPSRSPVDDTPPAPMKTLREAPPFAIAGEVPEEIPVPALSVASASDQDVEVSVDRAADDAPAAGRDEEAPQETEMAPMSEMAAEIPEMPAEAPEIEEPMEQLPMDGRAVEDAREPEAQPTEAPEPLVSTIHQDATLPEIELDESDLDHGPAFEIDGPLVGSDSSVATDVVTRGPSPDSSGSAPTDDAELAPVPEPAAEEEPTPQEAEATFTGRARLAGSPDPPPSSRGDDARLLPPPSPSFPMLIAGERGDRSTVHVPRTGPLTEQRMTVKLPESSAADPGKFRGGELAMTCEGPIYHDSRFSIQLSARLPEELSPRGLSFVLLLDTERLGLVGPPAMAVHGKPRATFSLVAVSEGWHRVQALAFHEGRFLARASCELFVLSKHHIGDPYVTYAEPRPSSIAPRGGLHGHDLVVSLMCDRVGEDYRLSYVIAGGEAPVIIPRPLMLPSSLVSSCRRAIAGSAATPRDRRARHLASAGEALWNAILPPDLAELLSRDEGVESLLIASEDTWIPWEILRPAVDAMPLGARLQIGQWPGTITPRGDVARDPALAILSSPDEVPPDSISETATVCHTTDTAGFSLSGRGWAFLFLRGPGALDGDLPAFTSIELSDGSLQAADFSSYAGEIVEGRPWCLLDILEQEGQAADSGAAAWATSLIGRLGAGGVIAPRISLAPEASREGWERVDALLTSGQTAGAALRELRRHAITDPEADPTLLTFALFGDPLARVTSTP